MMKFSGNGTIKVKAVGACLAAIIAVMALFMTAIPAAAAVGVGVSPPFLDIDDALRGTTYEEYITVFNTDNSSTNTYGLAAYEDISGWVSYYLPESPDTTITSIDIPARGTQRVLVKIAIPADIPNGAYNGMLSISAMATASGEGSVGVGLEAPVVVTIQVTGTQNISGKVNDILAYDVEVGYPLRLIVMFENTGNVAADPLIEATIDYKGTKVANFSSNGTKIAAGTTGNIEAEWDTTGNAPAEYTAEVTVSLDGKVLMQKDVPFNILPLGELTRSGELKDIIIDNAAIVGKPLKVQATFENTGQIDTNVYFTGEVYLEGNLIQVMTSDTLLVKHGQQEVLTAYFTPEQDGDLNIKVQATFEGKKSNIQEINITAIALKDIVSPPKSSATTATEEQTTTQSSTSTSTSQIGLYAGVGAVVVVLGGIVGVGTIRKRKQNGNGNRASGNGNGNRASGNGKGNRASGNGNGNPVNKTFHQMKNKVSKAIETLRRRKGK
jgi:hypothetical protein